LKGIESIVVLIVR